MEFNGKKYTTNQLSVTIVDLIEKKEGAFDIKMIKKDNNTIVLFFEQYIAANKDSIKDWSNSYIKEIYEAQTCDINHKNTDSLSFKNRSTTLINSTGDNIKSSNSRLLFFSKTYTIVNKTNKDIELPKSLFTNIPSGYKWKKLIIGKKIDSNESSQKSTY